MAIGLAFAPLAASALQSRYVAEISAVRDWVRMNEALEPTYFHPTRRTKRALIALGCVMLGSGLAGYLYPQHTVPGLKKQPAQTPTRQEPSRRPNTSLEAELVCGYSVARHTRAI